LHQVPRRRLDGSGKGREMPDIAYILVIIASFALVFAILKGVERL
jgi:hypothetical protein